MGLFIGISATLAIVVVLLMLASSKRKEKIRLLEEDVKTHEARFKSETERLEDNISALSKSRDNWLSKAETLQGALSRESEKVFLLETKNNRLESCINGLKELNENLNNEAKTQIKIAEGLLHEWEMKDTSGELNVEGISKVQFLEEKEDRLMLLGVWYGHGKMASQEAAANRNLGIISQL